MSALLRARQWAGRTSQIAWHLSEASSSIRWSSSSAAAWEQTLETPPGTELVISGCSDIYVKGSSVLGAVVSTLKAGSPWRVSSDKTTSRGFPVIEVTEGSKHQQAQSHPLLTAVIPEKWVTVRLATHGHRASVAKIVEADLTCDTQGGPAHIGTIRTMTAFINTVRDGAPSSSGPLEGKELSGSDVTVTTGGSPVTLKRLVGQRVSVTTQSAPFKASSVFGESVSITTGGGPISISTMDCSVSASLSSRGGAVTVGSCDGRADIQSGGGSVEVHLHHNARHVNVNSNGGDVQVAISHDAAMSITIESAGATQLGKGIDAESSTSDGGVLRVAVRPEGGPGTTRRGLPVPEGTLVISAGSGAVQVVREGWVEAMQRRMASASNA